MSGPLSLGRVTGALAAVNNENSVSLATANIDFTLLKVEAPAEYNSLGATISRKRKVDAEEGPLHRTARRLGALFEATLPSTDDLFRAYGKRVSEISSMPGVNPRESLDRDGIFASYIGADTASIWAAVTSGSAAIATHLLGCMLARIFTGSRSNFHLGRNRSTTKRAYPRQGRKCSLLPRTSSRAVGRPARHHKSGACKLGRQCSRMVAECR